MVLLTPVHKEIYHYYVLCDVPILNTSYNCKVSLQGSGSTHPVPSTKAAHIAHANGLRSFDVPNSGELELSGLWHVSPATIISNYGNFHCYANIQLYLHLKLLCCLFFSTLTHYITDLKCWLIKTYWQKRLLQWDQSTLTHDLLHGWSTELFLLDKCLGATGKV